MLKDERQTSVVRWPAKVFVLNSASVSSPPSSPRPPSYWQWIALCVLLVAAWAFAVAHAPPTWQRPGPTAFWMAIFSGVLVGGIGVINRVQSRRLIFVVAFVLVALAIAGMTAERYRLYVKGLEKQYLGQIQPRNTSDLGPALQYGEALENLLEEARQERLRIFEQKRPFRVFLTFRVQALGIETKPWPLLFFVGESVGGGLVAAFVAISWHRMQTQPAEVV